jgi:hypothetical protein
MVIHTPPSRYFGTINYKSASFQAYDREWNIGNDHAWQRSSKKLEDFVKGLIDWPMLDDGQVKGAWRPKPESCVSRALMPTHRN